MKQVFILVDLQNDFMPGGSLGVPGAGEAISLINRLIPHYPLILATQDWHPLDHTSFAANHKGKKVGEMIEVNGILQILWPVHCVRYTHGAELVSSLNKDEIDSIFFKGTDKWIDSYSAFFDNARKRSTGLAEYLQSRKIEEITIAGVATDYCVLYSTIDALDLGFSVTVIQDACRGIDLHPDDVERSWKTMEEKGAKLITSREILV